MLDLNTRMSESDPKNNLEPQTAADSRQGRARTACRRRSSTSFEAIPDDLVMPLENTLADVSIGQGITLLPHMRELRIIGPSTVTGVSDTPSRRRIFSCRPTTAAEEAACAREIVSRLATQAFRGPVSGDDVQGLLAFYEEGRAAQRLREAASGSRCRRFSPARASCSASKKRRPTVRPGQSYRLSDADLASRLSFFLWGTVPDAELLKVVADRTLRAPGVLDKQIKRMLARSARPRRCRRALRRSGCGCRISTRSIPTTCSTRSTTIAWPRRSSARPSCSSTASCARIAACSI